MIFLNDSVHVQLSNRFKWHDTEPECHLAEKNIDQGERTFFCYVIIKGGFFFLQTNFDFLTSHFWQKFFYIIRKALLSSA